MHPCEHPKKFRLDNVLELYAQNVINSKDEKEIANKLIVTFITNYSQLPTGVRDEFFTRTAHIWKSTPRRETIITLCRLRAASPQKIASVTGITRPNLSRALNYLKSTGLISLTQKIRVSHSKGGPKPSIYGILGYKPEDIRNAAEEHLRISSPAFNEAERLTQLILDDNIVVKQYHGDGLTSKYIQNFIRCNSSGYDVPILVSFVSSKLNEKGIPIWR